MEHFALPGGRIITDVSTKTSHIESLVYEELAREMDISLSYHRSWATGPDSLSSLFQNVPNMEGERAWKADTYDFGLVTESKSPGDCSNKQNKVWNAFEGQIVKNSARKRYTEKLEDSGAKGVEEDAFYIVVGKKI